MSHARTSSNPSTPAPNTLRLGSLSCRAPTGRSNTRLGSANSLSDSAPLVSATRSKATTPRGSLPSGEEVPCSRRYRRGSPAGGDGVGGARAGRLRSGRDRAARPRPTATACCIWSRTARPRPTRQPVRTSPASTGQTFTSASFTLASAAQCQGGSPRFDVVTTTGTFFLGCNNVIPIDERQRHGDVHLQRCDDRRRRRPGAVPDRHDHSCRRPDRRSGQRRHLEHHVQRCRCRCPAAGPTSKDACKNGGWKTFSDPSFKNQGQCVAYANHHNGSGADDE